VFDNATMFETSHAGPAAPARRGLLFWLTFLVSGALCIPSLSAATRSHYAINLGGPKAIYAGQIVFTPGTIQLNNAGQVTVNMTVFDSAGRIVTPTNDHPLHVNVYGVPAGVISPPRPHSPRRHQ
jgi:hypothetical protein